MKPFWFLNCFEKSRKKKKTSLGMFGYDCPGAAIKFLCVMGHFFFFLETLYLAQADLHLTVLSRLASTSRSSTLSLLSAGFISPMPLHPAAKTFF